ncbi:DUF3892 domain-containing protein [Sphingobium sp. RAC03]|uniref:DUF3892 domain-containing protein n=1 Tax=Sphingobium sp. RAC03 TaxID=1843368 RepID=UPI00083CFE47
MTAVKLQGNKGFTPLETAMRMADNGQIENAHSVNRAGAKPHLRTNPNSSTSDNLDDMAGDS